MKKISPVDIAKLTWQTPIGLSSGHIGYADYLQNISDFDWSSVGALFLKATTTTARLGNPEQRVVETPQGLLNSVGLENPGVEAVISHHLPKINHLPVCKIANIAGSDLDEYAQVTEAFEATTIDAIELNISCPNVKRGGATFGNDPVLAAEVVECVRKATNKPLIVKLSPNQTAIEKTAESCIKAGAQALSAINTVSAMWIDVKQQRPALANGFGGLSGAAIFPIALLNVHKVYQVAKDYQVPIIGQGGISNAEDAIAMFLAGASAISLGSVLANDIHSPSRILKGIQLYLGKHNLANCAELTGKLKFPA